MAVQKTREEIEDEFREAVSNLKTLSEEYERGNQAIAKPLANTIYTLVYDRGSNRSLFQHLKRKDADFFSAPHFPGPKKPGYMPLVRISAEMSNQLDDQPVERIEAVYWCFVGSHEFKQLDMPGTGNVAWARVPFKKWWDEVVLVTPKARMTRGEIVLMMTNRLGGRHSAHVLSESDASILRDAVVTGSLGLGEKRHDFKIFGLHRAYIRQIAYELQHTIDAVCGDLLESTAVVPPRIPDSGSLTVVQDRTYLKGVLEQLAKENESQSEHAYWVRSLIYWHSQEARQTPV